MNNELFAKFANDASFKATANLEGIYVGLAGTVEVGTVTEGEAVDVKNVGTKQHAVLNFVLRRGEKGDPGGPPGKDAVINGQNVIQIVAGRGVSINQNVPEVLEISVKDQTALGNVTIYVDATDGDDANDGTHGKPFKTIQAAVDSLPKNLGGRFATIMVSDGNYLSKVSLFGFSCGRLDIRGNTITPANVIVPSVIVHGCSCSVHLTGVNVQYVEVYDTHEFSLGTTTLSNPTEQNGISVQNSNVSMYSVDISGCNCAISVQRDTKLCAGGITGSGNTVGLMVNVGDAFPGLAILNNCNFGATAEIQKGYNSIVFKDGALV